MRELHVVALSEDGRSVVLATSPDATRGGFRVLVDERLAAAVRGDLGRPGATRPPGQELTPKEIQARLRAGESPEQIAHTAGVDLGRVERFSGPVLSERARVIDAVQAAVLERPRSGASALPLGEAVQAHLDAQPHLREDSVQWTARREADGAWVVELSWVARGRTRAAAWRWDPAERTVVPEDPASAALAHADEALAAAQLRGAVRTSTGRGRRSDAGVRTAAPVEEPNLLGSLRDGTAPEVGREVVSRRRTSPAPAPEGRRVGAEREPTGEQPERRRPRRADRVPAAAAAQVARPVRVSRARGAVQPEDVAPASRGRRSRAGGPGSAASTAPAATAAEPGALVRTPRRPSAGPGLPSAATPATEPAVRRARRATSASTPAPTRARAAAAPVRPADAAPPARAGAHEPPPGQEPAARKAPAEGAAAKQTAAKQTAARRSPAKQTAAKQTAAKRTPAKQTAAKRAAAEQEPAKRIPATPPVAKQTLPEKASATKASAKKASAQQPPASREPDPAEPGAAAPAATGGGPEQRPAGSGEPLPAPGPATPGTPAGTPLLRVVPPHPEAGHPRAPRAPRSRAAVPSWADVLLSTAPRAEPAPPDDAPPD